MSERMLSIKDLRSCPLPRRASSSATDGDMPPMDESICFPVSPARSKSSSPASSKGILSCTGGYSYIRPGRISLTRFIPDGTPLILPSIFSFWDMSTRMMLLYFPMISNMSFLDTMSPISLSRSSVNSIILSVPR